MPKTVFSRVHETLVLERSKLTHTNRVRYSGSYSGAETTSSTVRMDVNSFEGYGSYEQQSCKGRLCLDSISCGNCPVLAYAL
jgi:hypothetical protein